MKLVQDKDSFAEPLERAIEESVAAVIDASTPVRGAENRVAIALEQKKDLQEFDRRIQELLEHRAFVGLPRFHRRGRVVPNLHQLTVGVWRGVFLVDPKGEFAVALLFSKAPHRLDDRLDELVRKHATTDEATD